MELEILEIKEDSNTPIQTINKKEKPKVYFTINKLTSDLSLTTDQLFKIFKNNNTDLLDTLITENKNIIEKDSSCRCYSMMKRKNNYSRKCKGCQIISRLIKTNYLESEEIEIFSGRFKNMSLRIISNYFLKEIEYNQRRIVDNMLYYFFSNMRNIESYDMDVEHFSTENPECNYLVNSLIMNTVLKEEKVYLYNNFLWGFICNSIFTHIEKSSTFNNLDQLCSSPYYSNYSSPILSSQERKLSKNTVYMIIKELTFLLKTLSKNYFIHGNPTTGSISYMSEKITIKEETYPLKIVMKLSEYSSMNYKKKRYFHNLNNKFLNFGIPFEKIDVHINGSKSYFIHHSILNNYDEISILFYKIGNKSTIFNKMRNEYSIPICHKSYDFVCFLISFIKDNLFFKTFIECEKLVKTWKFLWKTDEYESLMNDIESLEENCYEYISLLVKKYYIRFDALEYFYNEIFS